MERSIPQPIGPDPEADAPAWWRDERTIAIVTGIALVLLCAIVYMISRPERHNFYVHFLWQADAWLHGQSSIQYPVSGVAGLTPGNDWYQDVMPLRDAAGNLTGRAIIPFPPLPALVLTPFVAVFGLFTDEQLIAMLLAAVDVGIAFWMLGGLRIGYGVRVLTALFFGLGTVLWYAAATGTTWFWAHIVAVACLLLAAGVALRADPGAAADEPLPGTAERRASPFPGLTAFLRDGLRLNARQLLAGFLFGLAVTARLTVGFGFPFFLFVGGGRNWLGRGLSAGLGALVPVAVLLLYTQAATGQPFNPAYEYQYRLEAYGYPFLHYNPAWSIEDIRYVPQNIQIMLANLPSWLPNADAWGHPLCVTTQNRTLLDLACPLALPDPVGTSILLTSPAFLLGFFVLRPLRRLRMDRVTAGAAIAVAAIAFVNLMHFSQGWVQFGYRFSNDFIPFALLLVAIGAARTRRLWPLALLVVLSIAINAWGVYWGGVLGW